MATFNIYFSDPINRVREQYELLKQEPKSDENTKQIPELSLLNGEFHYQRRNECEAAA